MRRTWLYIVIILIIAVAAGLVYSKNNDNKTSNKTTSKPPVSTATAFPNRKACEIFTMADAQKILGSSAKAGSDNGTSTSTDSMYVSSCSYSAGSKTASLIAYAPKNGAGTTSNQEKFGAGKPASAQHVSGYGDNAFWDQQTGQLDILKHNAWYVVINGPTNPPDRTLGDAKTLADILVSKM